MKLVFDNAWESFETEIFKHEIKPRKVVLDLDANFGYYTLLAAQLVLSQFHLHLPPRCRQGPRRWCQRLILIEQRE